MRIADSQDAPFRSEVFSTDEMFGNHHSMLRLANRNSAKGRYRRLRKLKIMVANFFCDLDGYALGRPMGVVSWSTRKALFWSPMM
jgi:hypothetical protein